MYTCINVVSKLVGMYVVLLDPRLELAGVFVLHWLKQKAFWWLKVAIESIQNILQLKGRRWMRRQDNMLGGLAYIY